MSAFTLGKVERKALLMTSSSSSFQATFLSSTNQVMRATLQRKCQGVHHKLGPQKKNEEFCLRDCSLVYNLVCRISSPMKNGDPPGPLKAHHVCGYISGVCSVKCLRHVEIVKLVVGITKRHSDDGT